MTRGRIILVSVLIVFSLIVVRLLTAPAVTSFFRGGLTMTRPFTSSVRFKGVSGPEDMEAIAGMDILLISSVDRSDSKKTGALYYIDLRQPLSNQKAVRLEIDYPRDFHPHGMSYRILEGQAEVYVISHRPGGHDFVEIFLLRKTPQGIEAIYRDSIPYDGPYSPNEIVVLPDGTFFISHDGKKPAYRILPLLFNLHQAPLSWWDGHTFHTLGPRMVMGNGVVYQKIGGEEFLYRADTAGRYIDKYQLLRRDNLLRLRKIQHIRIPSSPDNLTMDDTGNLYVACHYSFGLFLAHVRNHAFKAPSQVFRISPAGKVELIYADQGEQICAASVAVMVEKVLYLGQVYGDFIEAGEIE